MSLMFCMLSLTAGLSLLSAGPVYGRWEVPQTVEPVEETHSSPGKMVISAPTPTPVVLPDQAQVPILMYHYVSELPPNPDRYRLDLTVLPENFQAQLQYLADAGYHTITLTDLYLHLTQGVPLPEKPIVLTFDDGYRDAYEVVFPLLLDYGFTGTFFVLATPTHFESPDYMTWAQMKEMSDAGMEIQSHGRDHVDLRGRSYDYLVYQTLGIQEAIQYHTGRLPRFFCYPSGRYDDNLIAVLKSAGYWGAVTTEWGQTHTREGLFEMPRLRIRGSDTLESFVDRLED
ncbi:MAG: polysaccharide deacetylase family protein [Anaerolineae bacterium]|nr:polysaccharide deacetylase family protein [Anaerolineae bacterium]